ncbi:MAG TPA: ATP-binding protein [Pyrinomonadaceae bacterium]|nr:ATP-binding protein [Pyrinomonadaceae bacterium]
MLTPYANNWEHLSAEFRLLDLLLRREVARVRTQSGVEPQVFKGVYLSEAEIDQLLSAPEDETQSDANLQGADTDALSQEIAARRTEIEQRTLASYEHGVRLAVPHLAQLFGFNTFETQALVVCLALEADLKYEKLFAYLQDDITRKRPSVELLLRLLCNSPQERIRARAYFSPQSKLFRARLLRCAEGADAPLLARRLQLDERIGSYLLGAGGVGHEVAASARLASAPFALAQLRWPEELKTRLLTIAREHLERGRASDRLLIYHFHGAEGAGKKSLAAALCQELDVPLLVIDLRRALAHGRDFEATIAALFREALLQPAALFLEHFDLLLAEQDERLPAYRRAVVEALEEFAWLTFVVTEKEWEPAGEFKRHLFLSVELSSPEADERGRLWRTLADERGCLAADVDWEELAGKFRLTPGQIERAFVSATNGAHLRAGRSVGVDAEALYAACRAQSNQRLGTLARKLKLRHEWSDLVVPPNAHAQLRELCAQMKHRSKVFGTWGFGRAVGGREGICALFYGASGTGKTMAVEIIARELGLDAYKIDLSTVVSKYIGETEKNLSKIFREAETSNAILFFDEADALFGKRSEVKDAHDRYANIEINFLLQRVEEFDGMVVLATNLRKNIDDAFFRRVSAAVEFPFPEEGERFLIWQRHFPAGAPVDEDVDFDFLASRLNVAGGNIKNIAVNAAFMAAENSGRIHMRHVIRAARREYEKIGRMCTEMEFSPYHSMLSD